LEATITAPTVADPVATYSRRRDDAERQREVAASRWNRVGNLRLALFVVLACLVGWALIDAAVWKWVAAAAIVAVLVMIIPWHAGIRRKRDAHAALVTVNQLALARLGLYWVSLPFHDASVPRTHPYAHDLDITGHASILQRISTPVLHHGVATIRAWLLEPASPGEIASRQQAVRELAPMLDLRQRLEAIGRASEGAPPDPEPFLAWARQKPWLLRRPWLWTAAIISPLALVVLAALWLAGAITAPLWLAPIVINVALFQLFGGQVSERVAQSTPLRDAMRGYAGVFRLIAASNPTSPKLRDIVDRLDESGATGQLGAFARIAGFAIPRGSIIWMPLQMATLWDVHVLHSLERWRQRSHHDIGAWFAAAGEWEALAALSVLAHDHLEWAFAEVDPGATAVEAAALAHPLIATTEAVANDVTVGPEGTFLFVTGSNMSGKSTLLRAIGVNAVLAQAGGPVAATALRMPPLDPWTCMRVEDSLERGVSYFMAELQRLKAVVDAARAATGRPVLYLLDEILQGTNTAERQVASRQVLAQLCASHAIGGVSSHDLDLVNDPRIAGRAVAVHFAETLDHAPGDAAAMTFDYRLRPGPATSTNAIALMRLLGFEIDPAPDT
jgi:hypothetical protein